MRVVCPAEQMTFAERVLGGLADLQIPGAGHTDLTLDLGLSLWLRRTGVRPTAASTGLLALRKAVLEVSGLDRESEPVPLRGIDPRQDVRILGAYLWQLIGRAATAAGCSRAEVARRATALLEPAAPLPTSALA
jgi:hypothetical protein